MISYLLVTLADTYSLIIFVYVMMSWIPSNSGIVGDLRNVLGKLCDPYLNIFRRFIPPIGGMIDISQSLRCLCYSSG